MSTTRTRPTPQLGRTLSRVERSLERALALERGANVLPLLQVLWYYASFAALLVPGATTTPALRGALFLLLLLLNFSLSVGIQHLHCHRPLFTARVPNRILEMLLSFPSFSPSAEMVIQHIHFHHRGNNGPDDPSSTRGYEKGWRAIWYWSTYTSRSIALTCRELFRRDVRRAWRTYRARFVTDLAVSVGGGIALFAWDPARAFWVYLVPLLFTHFATGYFAWLTHAPAAGVAAPDNGSLNAVSNVMGLLVFNQGYHSVHHRFPGLHWTEIPDKLDLLRGVEPGLIVPYWVTLNSAWRLLAPERFRDACFGRAWKERYEQRRARGRIRARWLPYFAWI